MTTSMMVAPTGTGNMNVSCGDLQTNGNSIPSFKVIIQFVPGIFYPAAWVEAAQYNEGDRVSDDVTRLLLPSSSFWTSNGINCSYTYPEL